MGRPDADRRAGELCARRNEAVPAMSGAVGDLRLPSCTFVNTQGIPLQPSGRKPAPSIIAPDSRHNSAAMSIKHLCH
jgi:hypothetical protein